MTIWLLTFFASLAILCAELNKFENKTDIPTTDGLKSFITFKISSSVWPISTKPLDEISLRVYQPSKAVS